MRYCRFQTADGPQYGEIARQDGTDFITTLLPPPPEDKRCVLSPQKFKHVAVDDVKLLAPVVPSKIICVGRNYRDHARELGNEVPTGILIFLKPPSGVIGPGDAIMMPAISRRVDFEGELGVIINQQCRNLEEREQVRSYIRGYVCANDVTARDLQKTDGQWTRAKGFDTFCPLGPIVSDEIDPWGGVEVETKVNGARRQLGNTRDFIFSLDKVLRYVSSVMTLYPGDLILTGTPAGVGPLENGDTVEISIPGIGQLENPVKAEKVKS
jgi:2-keto-4-pentenoate hydratase/2-oxohepta-3-ene-1,7-dioic acid hydratase in catechol pathway